MKMNWNKILTLFSYSWNWTSCVKYSHGVYCSLTFYSVLMPWFKPIIHLSSNSHSKRYVAQIHLRNVCVLLCVFPDRSMGRRICYWKGHTYFCNDAIIYDLSYVLTLVFIMISVVVCFAIYSCNERNMKYIKDASFEEWNYDCNYYSLGSWIFISKIRFWRYMLRICYSLNIYIYMRKHKSKIKVLMH